MYRSGQVSNHKPRKGTETSHRSTSWSPNLGVSNHKPRKGTETVFFRCRTIGQLVVSNHKPRKGTETHSSPRHSATRRTRFKSQTPQGDGNGFSIAGSSSAVSFVSNHKPRKGTETWSLLCLSWPVLVFQITNPARGRKLSVVAPRSLLLLPFQITNPARGRKPTIRPLSLFVSIIEFQITNPARGRKRVIPPLGI